MNIYIKAIVSLHDYIDKYVLEDNLDYTVELYLEH